MNDDDDLPRILYGVMLLMLPPGMEIEEWKLKLLESIGHHIGAALATAKRTDERRRIALMEERSVIARELHDSLAQSLSYLKIQVTRLKSYLDGNRKRTQTADVVSEPGPELVDLPPGSVVDDGSAGDSGAGEPAEAAETVEAPAAKKTTPRKARAKAEGGS